MQLGGLGKRCKLPSGSGAEPQPKSTDIWWMATILTILVRVNWPNCLKWFLKIQNLTRCTDWL